MAKGNDQEPVYPGRRLSPEERKGAMIGEGLIWCQGCGDKAVRIDMGHKQCRFCRHPALAQARKDLIRRYVKAGLPIPDNFDAVLGSDDSD